MIVTTKFKFYSDDDLQYFEERHSLDWVPFAGYMAGDVAISITEDKFPDLPWMCSTWVDRLITPHSEIGNKEIHLHLSRWSFEGASRAALDGSFDKDLDSDGIWEDEEGEGIDMAILLESSDAPLTKMDKRNCQNSITDWRAVCIVKSLYGMVQKTLRIEPGVPFYFKITPVG